MPGHLARLLAGPAAATCSPADSAMAMKIGLNVEPQDLLPTTPTNLKGHGMGLTLQQCVPIYLCYAPVYVCLSVFIRNRSEI